MTRAELKIEGLLARVPVGIRTNPFEAFVAVLGMFSGLLYLIGIAQSTALSQYAPGWLAHSWGGLFSLSCALLIRGLLNMADVGGIVVLLGRAVAAYKLGLRLMIGACLIYGPAVFFYSPNPYGAFPYFALAAAAAQRLLVIRVSSARTPGWKK